jgi:hypothetical protein
MRAAIIAFVLAAVACERGPQTEANLPQAPGTAPPPTSTGDLPQPTPPGSVTPCTILPPETAASMMTSLPAVVTASGWTVNGSSLACAMPNAEGAVECELAAGGTAVATQANKTYGFRNDTAAPLSVSINSEGMSCGPLKTPPSPS